MNFAASILFSFFAVIILVLIPWVGVGVLDLRVFFGIIVPYLAFATFILFMVIRVVDWARSPVPFRIPTTAGQQKSLPWIRQSRLDNPSSTLGVVGRMILEVLLFRSLFRNTRMEFREGAKIGYEWEKWLWLGALAFHWSLLVVIVRHLRFFTHPIPGWVHLIESLDGFFQNGILPLSGLGVPGILLSGLILLLAVTFLFLRRIFTSQVRYISLPSDYFPLFLIIGIALSGVLMRYTGRLLVHATGGDVFTMDIVKVKELAMGLISFRPNLPEGIGVLFFIHLFLVSILAAYFPFSKLVHMAGIFLSPTRNLSNNSRMVRHVNPWDYPVKVHTYEEYEDEFRDKMVEAGLPVEKMPEPAEPKDPEPQEKTEKE